MDCCDFIYFYSYSLYSNIILCVFNNFLVILWLQYLWHTDVKTIKWLKVGFYFPIYFFFTSDRGIPVHQVKMKETKTIDKYLNLTRELKNLWNMKVIPIVIEIFKMVPKGLEKRLGENWRSKEQWKPLLYDQKRFLLIYHTHKIMIATSIHKSIHQMLLVLRLSSKWKKGLLRLVKCWWNLSKNKNN